MKITTGFDFQGYFITEYYDVIFDEMLIGLGLGKSLLSTIDNFASALTGSEATVMVEKLNSVKEELRNRVIRKAEKLGANALIGIDFESSKLGDIIMVSMTATAVHIEKIISDLPFTEKDQREAEKKVEEEKRRKEKIAWQAAREEMFRTNQMNTDAIISIFTQLDDAKEMKNTITDLSQKYPGYFYPEFLESLDNSVLLGKMYGKRLGADDFISKLKEYLAR